jgi:hypothetical protein
MAQDVLVSAGRGRRRNGGGDISPWQTSLLQSCYFITSLMRPGASIRVVGSGGPTIESRAPVMNAPLSTSRPRVLPKPRSGDDRQCGPDRYQRSVRHLTVDDEGITGANASQVHPSSNGAASSASHLVELCFLQHRSRGAHPRWHLVLLEIAND